MSPRNIRESNETKSILRTNGKMMGGFGPRPTIRNIFSSKNIRGDTPLFALYMQLGNEELLKLFSGPIIDPGAAPEANRKLKEYLDIGMKIFGEYNFMLKSGKDVTELEGEIRRRIEALSKAIHGSE